MENNHLEDLSNRIYANTDELHHITKVIRQYDPIVATNLNPDEKLLLDENIERYKFLINKTKTLLECYFAEEEKAGIPTYFTFRRLYKKLEDAL